MSTNKERESGYYWVKCVHGDWQVCAWISNIGFYSCGISQRLLGIEILDVEETPITRKEK